MWGCLPVRPICCPGIHKLTTKVVVKVVRSFDGAALSTPLWENTGMRPDAARVRTGVRPGSRGLGVGGGGWGDCLAPVTMDTLPKKVPHCVGYI